MTWSVVSEIAIWSSRPPTKTHWLQTGPCSSSSPMAARGMWVTSAVMWEVSDFRETGFQTRIFVASLRCRTDRSVPCGQDSAAFVGPEREEIPKSSRVWLASHRFGKLDDARNKT